MTLSRKTTIAQIVSLSGYFVLLALLALWITTLRIEPIIPTSVLLLVAIGPLLLPLRGLLHGRPYTYAWASMLSLLYLIHAITELYSSADHRLLAAIELIAGLCFYVGAVLYARWKSQAIKQQAASAALPAEDLTDKGDGETSLGDQ